MKVVNIKLINGKRTPLIEEVPASWRKCSVTGEYRPYEEFCDSDGKLSRTNCTFSYLLPSKEWDAIENEVETIQKSKEYQTLVKKIQDDSDREDFIKNCLTIKQLILKLQEHDQDMPVTITCNRDPAGFDFQEDEYLGVKFLSLNDIDVDY